MKFREFKLTGYAAFFQKLPYTRLEHNSSPEAYLSNIPSNTPALITDRAVNLDAARKRATFKATPKHVKHTLHTRAFPLRELIECEIKSPLDNLKNYHEGPIPVVSATYYNNGIKEWLDIPPELRLRDCMTISKTHNTRPCEAFWHPYEFSAIDTVHVVKPIEKFLNSELAMIYLCQVITESNAWRYDYARNVKLHEIEVYLPECNGYPDIDAIVTIVKTQLN